ncbi:MAG: UDP-N-acetylmuramoyl-L-alanyl-D-glutamate--2,6-diaminopimelate ligase [Oscillospiraceae bacterium]|jgi:UDP-N-acetylmuramoyl-L-alanyl-D-glutamate--2,6-diaminopimelate ligase|nr:UDP-N-acetylmuramoyl-L-alanyl-D-glutamate--2,6-diaminopimelate ligase [Oscillospiraceae bacterium]
MTFKELLQDIPYTLARGDDANEVADLAYDSRKAMPDGCFICVPGFDSDGHSYALSAYENGARLFLCQHIPEGIANKSDCIIALAEDTRKGLALAAARWFGFPAKEMKLIGITGTKGKTSITQLLKNALEEAGHTVGVIGSMGAHFAGHEMPSMNTTPESYEIHALLRRMVDAGVDFCVMEASSQGFLLHRTYGLHFDASVFTNISADHISKTEHKDFEEYLNCKKMIFDQSELTFVNRDAEQYREIIRGVSSPVQTYGFHAGVDFRAKNVCCGREKNKLGVTFIVQSPFGEFPMRVNQPGKFSASNALAAICVALYFGVSAAAISEGMRNTVVCGRMEQLSVPAPYSLVIDFAHNRLSVQSMIETARQYRPRKVICVFGLEGERAKVRRLDSGELLGKGVDYTILANASPRRTDPMEIIGDIAGAIDGAGGKYSVIPDRREAITFALDMAGEGDLVLLVGKGDKLYEEIGKEKIPFDERKVVSEYFVGKET